MKRIILRILIALLTFTAGLTLARIIGSFAQLYATPKVLEIEQVGGLKLDSPPPPPPPPLPVAVEIQRPIEILDYDLERFSPEGSYEISGKAPNGFEDFFYFSINPGDLSTTAVSMAVKKSAENYEYLEEGTVFALVTPKRLLFVTKTFENGFEYRFDGQFLRGKVLMNYPEGTVVLQGTLTKSRNGKTVANAKVKFRMIWDHC